MLYAKRNYTLGNDQSASKEVVGGDVEEVVREGVKLILSEEILKGPLPVSVLL